MILTTLAHDVNSQLNGINTLVRLDHHNRGNQRSQSTQG